MTAVQERPEGEQGTESQVVVMYRSHKDTHSQGSSPGELVNKNQTEQASLHIWKLSFLLLMSFLNRRTNAILFPPS